MFVTQLTSIVLYILCHEKDVPPSNFLFSAKFPNSVRSSNKCQYHTKITYVNMKCFFNGYFHLLKSNLKKKLTLCEKKYLPTLFKK